MCICPPQTHTCVYMHVWVSLGRPALDVGSLPQLLSTLLIEAVSQLNFWPCLGNHSRLSTCNPRFRDRPTHLPNIYMNVGNLNCVFRFALQALYPLSHLCRPHNKVKGLKGARGLSAQCRNYLLITFYSDTHSFYLQLVLASTGTYNNSSILKITSEKTVFFFFLGDDFSSARTLWDY